MQQRMKMTRAEKIAHNKDRARITKAFSTRCSGIGVDIMDLGRIYAEGHKAIAEGVDDAVLGDRVAAFVQTIRKS